MSCAKKYGPGAIFVNKEASFNSGASLGYLVKAQSASIGALNREMIDNNELRMNRGKTEPLPGAQSELTWEIQVQASFDGSAATDGLGCLFWAAGRDGSNLANNSICGRTLQIVRFDRDGLLVESLCGCLVQNISYSFSTTDLCTITFSGVAASKIVINTPTDNISATFPATSSAFQLTHDNLWFDTGMLLRNSASGFAFYIVTNFPTGILAKCFDADGSLIGTAAVTGMQYSTGSLSIQLTPTAAADEATAISKVLFVPNEAQYTADSYDFVSPADWSAVYTTDGTIMHELAVQTCEITMETGLSFGELTTAAPWPTEIISANNNISGSFTVYLDDNAAALLSLTNVDLRISQRGGAVKIKVPNAILTTKPAYELAPDSAASGDFEFTGAASDEESNDGIVW